MEIITSIMVGISLSACTGFRAFLPPFIVGLMLKFFPLSVMFLPGMSFFSKDPVLIALGIAVVVEFLGDKIPIVDHFLDVIQLPVKFIVSGILTYSIIPPGEFAWVFTLITFVLGSGTTVAVHAGKAGMRAASTGTTGGLLNPLISLLEEIIAMAGTLFALIAPILSGLLIIFILYKCFTYLFGKTGGNDGKIARTPPSLAFVKGVKIFLTLWFQIFNNLKIMGGEHFPANGPYVVIANHASMIDGFVLGVGVPRPLFIMVKKEAFENPIIGWVLRKCLAFPIDRERPDPRAIRTALQTLEDGNALGLFPEGTRNFNGQVRPFKPGALKIALKQKSAIVPAYISNTHLLMPPGAWFPRMVPIRISFGKPIELARLLDDGKKEEEIQKLIFDEVCKLGFQELGRDVREIKPGPAPAVQVQQQAS